MASTSASPVPKSFKYDVFLSFRGEDTRKNFVDHLYHALHQKGIITYKDDEKIVKGERITDHLTRSIEESRIHIIVFSKNYASSSWCLEELVKIIECQKTKEQTAYPIFFDVEPTEVRHQSGAFGKAFAEHEKGSWSFVLPLDYLCSSLAFCCSGSSSLNSVIVDPQNEDDVGRWRNALKEAANLAGMELKTTFNGHEAKFIQQIVQEISLKLHFINSSIDGKLVGMETRVKRVVSSLETSSKDVRLIGIKGIGGGGKTTLARAVFDLISVWFEGVSFVENVREVSKGSLTGLKELQKQVLKDVLADQNIDLTSVSDGKNKIKRNLPGRKALVVLDDVDDINQLEALAGKLTWFKPGSRIVITTRDQQVLVAHGVSIIHDVNMLSDEEALCLFSRYAFMKDTPNQGYEELSSKVVHYAAVLPLTIKVLGSHLCGRSDHVWKGAIEKLKTIPEDQTLKRLEISYNGLEDDQKEIFLDVVCMLKDETKEDAIRILDSCGYYAEISVLEQKSLITVSNDRLSFHDHIEEMGWNIVRRLHPNEPSRHSRLWIKEEIEYILVKKLGTKETRSMKLGYSNLNSNIIMKGVRKMEELRLLNVQCDRTEVDEVSKYLPDALQSLCWRLYPFRSLPNMFQANKLVNLEMFGSNITELWEGGERKVFNKLKFLDLSYSKLKTFDLSLTPHLEFLNLTRCEDLEELRMPVECPNLEFLNLSYSKVNKLNLGITPHLELLNLTRCEDLVELRMPVECPNLEFLNLSYSKVNNLNLGITPHLEELYLEGCEYLVELCMPVECLNLKFLNLSYSKVKYLNLGKIPHIEELYLEECEDLVELCIPVVCLNLKFLKLSYSKVNKLNLGLTPHLEELYLTRCSYLQEIHTPVGCIKTLVKCRLVDCLNFAILKVSKLHDSAADHDFVATFEIIVDFVGVSCPLHPNNNLRMFRLTCKYYEPKSSPSGNLEKLISFGPCVCKNLEYLLATIYNIQHLRELRLDEGSPRDLCRLQSLEKLLLRWQRFQHLPDSICMLKNLQSLELVCCYALERLPENICKLECLEDLIIHGCQALRDIPNNICKMKRLRHLEFIYCRNIMYLPEELGSLECLKVLDIKGTNISRLPQSIYQLKGLRINGSREQLESYGFTSVISQVKGSSEYACVEL